MCDARTKAIQTPPISVDNPALRELMAKVTMEKAQAAADTCYDLGDSPKKEGFMASYMESTPSGIRTIATISLIGILAGVFLMRRK
jgi:hypothetical protein